MDRMPELEITISTANQVTLRFSDPFSGVLPNEYSGPWSRPAGLAHPEDDPEAHGRALRDALVHDLAVRAEFTRALTLTVRATASRPLRVYLRLPPELHELSWETLLNPDNDQPLLGRSKVHFFRFLPGEEPIVAAAARRRALVFIANPPRLETEKVSAGGVRLHKVDVAGERQRAQGALRPLVPTEITSMDGQPGVASLDRLVSALRAAPDPYHILYLVCHGAVSSHGPELWLDEPDGKPVDAQRLVDGLRGLDPELRPRLVVLASCQSAGQPGTEAVAQADRLAINAIGPKLVQEAGIAAVVAMQGNVFMRSVEVMMPAFFKELDRSGQIERAMAVARGRLRIETDALIRNQWRVPVLFSRLRDGQLWPAGQISSRVVYLSHAIQPADAEWEALIAVRRTLEDGGFDIVESALGPAVAPASWSQRLFEGLGTCDAAVLLLNRRSLDQAGNAQTEARILCWRQRLESEFTLIPLCVDASCQPALQQAPWALLCEAGAADLAWTSTEDLEAKVRELLAPLQSGAPPAPGWKLAGLQETTTQHFEKMGFDNILRSVAESLQAQYALPLLQEPPARWWARASLSKGPCVLHSLYNDVLKANRVTKTVTESVRELLGPVRPAWVDIASVVQLAAQAKQSPGSFYLRSEEPELDIWIAECYAARACGQAQNLFETSPCLLLVTPALAGIENHADRADRIRATLRDSIKRRDQELWSRERASILKRRVPRDRAEQALDDAGQDSVDKVIRGCVTARAMQGRPILLLLSGETSHDTELLKMIQASFGPVGFFFMGSIQPPAGAEFDISLVSDLAEDDAFQAQVAWYDLEAMVQPQ